jgi:hypothetical protein
VQPFRAALTDDDDAGQAIADVEGSIHSPEETPGLRQGEFELQETESFMQGVLEKKTFRLELDDGNRLTIREGSVSSIAGPGSSRVEFSAL